VATFIGSPPMNLWHARLVERDGRVILLCGDQRLVVPATVLARHKGLGSHVGGHLVLGLRPEMLAPARNGASGSVVDLPVVLVEDLGSHVLVHLEAEGAGMQLADAGQGLGADVRDGSGDAGTATFSRPTATLTARLPAHTRVYRGERLRVSVDLERAHFFDPSTQFALG